MSIFISYLLLLMLSNLNSKLQLRIKHMINLLTTVFKRGDNKPYNYVLLISIQVLIVCCYIITFTSIIHNRVDLQTQCLKIQYY